jgi:hypothetical protein
MKTGRVEILFVIVTAMLTFGSLASAADFCVTGLKGTIAANYFFKISQTSNAERMVSLIDASKNASVFSSKAENRFTLFNSSGYGVCSISGSGIDAVSGAQYKLELKVASHFKNECAATTIPNSIEYLTLKITPKGTTLGDDFTAYALTVVPCP